MSRASGLGSWPSGGAGSPDGGVAEAMRVVRDTLGDASRVGVPGIPYLPELPGRGPGADLIGRTAAILAGLAVDLQPSGWRLVDRPGKDLGRARAFLRGDLDQLAEAFEGWDGDLKVSMAGPWTMAAELRMSRGERTLVDLGACRDVAASLTEGLREFLDDVRRAVPGARLMLQLDEPMLPSVLAGELATSSGFGRLRAVDPEEARRALATLIEAVGVPVVVHCCAADAPLALLREAGVSGVSLDVGLLGPRGWESVAVCVEAGVAFWAGALPTNDLGLRPDAVAAPVILPYRELGLPARLLDDVVVTPACGLAGASPAAAVRAHRTVAEAAAVLTEAAAR